MNQEAFEKLNNEIESQGASLIAVSKTKSVEDILKVYGMGQRMFGENKAQEMLHKYQQLPKDIQWHFIGHLQRNKVKYIAPFVSLIHSVDSLSLLMEIEKEAGKCGRVVDVLLQFFIADETTKFGLDISEAISLLESPAFKAMKHIRICGVMGMATNTENSLKIKGEFAGLAAIYRKLKTVYFNDEDSFCHISMGMSHDYKLALKNGATLVRIGSAIFGER